MSIRTTIFWLIWAAVAACAIIWSIKVSADCYPTQGSGAKALLAPIDPSPPAVPTVIIPPAIHTFYFAAKATNAAGASDFSNEAVYVRTNSETYVTLTCDPPLTNNVDGYLLYWGKASGIYTNQSSWGTNRIFVARIVPAMPSNFVVSVTTSNATNIQWSTTLKGPWSLLGATNWTATNPAGTRLFRSMGRKAGSSSIRVMTRWN